MQSETVFDPSQRSDELIQRGCKLLQEIELLTAESEELRKESAALVAHSKLLLSQFAAELKLPKEKKDKGI